jgi:alpha-1,2-mannosyltransferase
VPHLFTAGPEPLRRWEKVVLVLASVGWVVFGGIVVLRSALQVERKTDFGVYARAAWAVRAGEPLYGITDDRGWHYCYPPPFALFVTPLADPPGWLPRDGYLPFSVSCGVWYALSLVFVGYAVHTFAGLVLPDEPRWSRRWWYARTMPCWATVGAIGMTLSRGQVNLLLVALFAGMFAAAARRRQVASGLWLASAICLKVIPGLLVLFPLVRREWRAAAGLTLGMVVGLGVLPAAVWGVSGAVEMNRTMLKVVLEPGATGRGDTSRARELTDGVSTDSQSFQAAIHNWRYRHALVKPSDLDRDTRLIHWAISGVVLGLTLLASRRAGPGVADQLIVFGGLCTVMLLMTPVSHMHYFVMALPLVSGVWLKDVAGRPGAVWATPATTAVLLGWGVLTGVALFPYGVTSWLREMGAGPLLTLGLLAYGMASLGERPAAVEPAGEEPEPLRRAGTHSSSSSFNLSASARSSFNSRTSAFDIGTNTPRSAWKSMNPCSPSRM